MRLTNIKIPDPSSDCPEIIYFCRVSSSEYGAQREDVLHVKTDGKPFLSVKRNMSNGYARALTNVQQKARKSDQATHTGVSCICVEREKFEELKSMLPDLSRQP